MAQQTAVEWLVEQLPQIDWDDPFYVGILQEANKMFEEQIKDAYWNGTIDMEKEDALLMAEDFYKDYYENNA